MSTIDHSLRSFIDNTGWHVYMRAGDENVKTYIGLQPVNIRRVADRSIAGPFKSERSMSRWLNHFTHLYGGRVKRSTGSGHIPNEVILPEWTSIQDCVVSDNQEPVLAA